MVRFCKKKCRNPKLLFTDTDSLCFETEQDFYEIMHKFPKFFYLSNFPKYSKYFCNDIKKVPRKMKDEYGGAAMYEYVGKKSKMYSIRDVNNCKKSTYKGHNSNIGYGEFINFHSNEKVIRQNMKIVKSSTALRCGSFSEKISKKSPSAIMIRIIVTFANQIFL